MRKILTFVRAAGVCSLGMFAVACGSDDSGSTSAEAASGDTPQIVVTTNVIGDIVAQSVGDLADVEVIMPVGSDPHDFAPSAQQAEAMENADLLVINGAGFEEGMLDIIDNIADSGTTPMFSFADHVEVLEFTGEHADEAGKAVEEAAGGSEDPHIWTDPSRMVAAVEALGVELGGVEGIDADVLQIQVDEYVAELTALDGTMQNTLAPIPADQRVLVTNHEVFDYFADRFDFEVVGAVIPSLTTGAEASAADIDALAELIEAAGIPAIFADTSSSTQLAEALAAEVGGGEVAVVELFSESLGPQGSGAETYAAMMSANATLIARALTPG